MKRCNYMFGIFCLPFGQLANITFVVFLPCPGISPPDLPAMYRELFSFMRRIPLDDHNFHVEPL